MLKKYHIEHNNTIANIYNTNKPNSEHTFMFSEPYDEWDTKHGKKAWDEFDFGWCFPIGAA